MFTSGTRVRSPLAPVSPRALIGPRGGTVPASICAKSAADREAVEPATFWTIPRGPARGTPSLPHRPTMRCRGKKARAGDHRLASPRAPIGLANPFKPWSVARTAADGVFGMDRSQENDTHAQRPHCSFPAAGDDSSSLPVSCRAEPPRIRASASRRKFRRSSLADCFESWMIVRCRFNASPASSV